MAKKKPRVLSSIIVDEIYPIIENALNAKRASLKSCIGRFVHSHHEQLYDTAPVDRIYFRKNDVDDFFRSIGVKENDIKTIMDKLYYINDDELQACKDPFSMCMMCAIRYYVVKLKMDSKDKDLELVATYLSFSGKFYASVHYKWFPNFVPKREVMDYVVNNMLSQKFDLVRTGSVWGAISSLTDTWLDSYEDIIKKPTDEEMVYIIHQLYTRIYSMFRNIAHLYFKAYEEKLYLNYESDNYDSENGKYRVTNNNSTIANGITETTMNYITTTEVSVARCQACATSGVNPLEIKAILETILNNNTYIDQLRQVINTLVVDFMRTHPDVKDVATSAEFVEYSIQMKPNSKDKDILEMKNIILNWLNTSDRYKAIKTPATRNNYYKGILGYIALTVNAANKNGK